MMDVMSCICSLCPCGKRGYVKWMFFYLMIAAVIFLIKVQWDIGVVTQSGTTGGQQVTVLPPAEPMSTSEGHLFSTSSQSTIATATSTGTTQSHVTTITEDNLGGRKKANSSRKAARPDPTMLANAQTEAQFRIMDNIVDFLQKQFPFKTDGVHKETMLLNKVTGALEENGLPFLWIFWEGPKRPAYVDLCLLTTVCHNHKQFNVRILNKSEFLKSVSNVHPSFVNLSMVHKADYFRVAMLNDYGGVYFDSDTISFKGMGNMYRDLRHYDVMGASSYTDSIHFGNLGPFRAHTNFTQKWLEQLHAKFDQRSKSLETGNDPFYWSEVGGAVAVPILDKLISQNSVRYHKVKGVSTWIQLNPNELMSEAGDLVKKLKETEIMSLNNKLYPDKYKKKTTHEVLRSRRGLSQLLRYSLVKCWNNLH